MGVGVSSPARAGGVLEGRRGGASTASSAREEDTEEAEEVEEVEEAEVGEEAGDGREEIATAPTSTDGDTPPNEEAGGVVVVGVQTEALGVAATSAQSPSSMFTYTRRDRRRARAMPARDIQHAAAESNVDGRGGGGSGVELAEIVVLGGCGDPNTRTSRRTSTSTNDADDNDTTGDAVPSPGVKDPNDARSSEEDGERYSYCRICMEAVSVADLDTDDATQLGCVCVSGRARAFTTPSHVVMHSHASVYCDWSTPRTRTHSCVVISPRHALARLCVL
jgi:hypothetical protein